MKKGFSLILAIIFILLVASIGALSMSISSSSAKTSVNLFIHEQAKLLADGAAEYAIMKVQQNNFATTCVDEIEINYPNNTNPTFRANISITYIGDKDTIRNCANKIESDKTGLESIIISGQVRSLLDEGAGNSRENLAYSFTTTQIP
ncbi:hypothetical protein [Campylobacter sp.]|uniref:hypothetical protein n=1 Tax=Campylobacter sp. TaxID=205 RepID=UPI002A7637B7|nr:hypothetical protein [Campylobacter sp.]MDY3245872.1 hypothetical protein [Campylobacter sp.]